MSLLIGDVQLLQEESMPKRYLCPMKLQTPVYPLVSATSLKELTSQEATTT